MIWKDSRKKKASDLQRNNQCQAHMALDTRRWRRRSSAFRGKRLLLNILTPPNQQSNTREELKSRRHRMTQNFTSHPSFLGRRKMGGSKMNKPRKKQLRVLSQGEPDLNRQRRKSQGNGMWPTGGQPVQVGTRGWRETLRECLVDGEAGKT